MSYTLNRIKSNRNRRKNKVKSLFDRVQEQVKGFAVSKERFERDLKNIIDRANSEPCASEPIVIFVPFLI